MKNKLSVFASLCAMAALLMSTQQVIACCRGALSLCLELIMPSLFPFFVLSGLLSRLGFPAYLGRALGSGLGRLFNVSGAGASAFFIGITGGYPMGASYIADMHESGQISAEEAAQLLTFCNNSGPAFILGAVGAGIFHSVKVGMILYCVHICAAFITGILLRRKGGYRGSSCQAPEPWALSRALPEAVRQAVVSTLNVCGFVVCFTVLAGLLDAWGLFSSAAGFLAAHTGCELHFSRAFLTGILELGSAIGAMQGMAASPANLALAAAILGWGGISVHFQTAAVLADAEIKTAPHFAGRLISALIGAGLAFAAGALFL